MFDIQYSISLLLKRYVLSGRGLISGSTSLKRGMVAVPDDDAVVANMLLNTQ